MNISISNNKCTSVCTQQNNLSRTFNVPSLDGTVGGNNISNEYFNGVEIKFNRSGNTLSISLDNYPPFYGSILPGTERHVQISTGTNSGIFNNVIYAGKIVDSAAQINYQEGQILNFTIRQLDCKPKEKP